MGLAQTTGNPLRLWPGVAAVAAAWVTKLAVPLVAPDASGYAVLAGLAGSLIVLVWWLLFSRAPWAERVGAVVLMVAGVMAMRPFVHKSIATAGMGFMLYIMAIPALSLALVAWAAVSRRVTTGPRWALLVFAVALACGYWTLLRTDGITGAGESQLAWRWTKSHEELPLPPLPAAPAAPVVVPVVEPVKAAALKAEAATPVVEPPPVWPGFRGPERDSIVRGVRIGTDWTAAPPVKLWQREVGPGWSSFAIQGDRFYTQEQRGEREVVACYSLKTGEPLWSHQDAARFWESNGGAGPRGTPTVRDGRVYTLGATGIVNVLNAATGAVVWSRNAAKDTGAKLPEWGFTSSPLLLDDIVVVAASGRMVAYDRATGQPRWQGGAHGRQLQFAPITGYRRREADRAAERAGGRSACRRPTARNCGETSGTARTAPSASRRRRRKATCLSPPAA